MQQQHCLKKVTFIIRKKYAAQLENVRNVLEQWGMTVLILWTEESLIKSMGRNFQALELTDPLFGKNQQLIVCDEEFLARRLQGAGYYVIVFCTQDNRKQNFSGFQYAIEGFEELDADYFIKVWQRFEKLPWQIGETKRCTIREMCETDISALYQLYKDPVMTKYMENLYEDRKKELSYMKNYREKIYSYYGFGTWLVLDKETGKLIGRAGFNYRPGFEEPELGFMIGAAYQRQGYAYEVCRYLLDFAKEVYEWNRIQALTHPQNIASVALLQKLGFVYNEEIRLEGQPLDRFLLNIEGKEKGNRQP